MGSVDISVEKGEVFPMATNPAYESWRTFLMEIQARVTAQTFNTWFRPLQFGGIAEDRLLIDAPGEFLVQWIEEHFLPVMEECAAIAFGRPLRICFRIDPGAAPEPMFIPMPVQPRVVPPRQRLYPDASSLDPGYTFETFVVGPSNQLTHAACLAVAEQPARGFNPLFIYGGVGLGKTHLMQAIGNRLRQTQPDCRMFYLSSEQFMNEMIESIQRNRTIEFKSKYRNADLLLIDDIQFLAGKESTQEEFFHTFNALLDAHRQIVVTSDRPPKDIPTLEERLISRFHWGLVTDIQAPDLETRVAILKRKAEADGIQLPDDVALLIANAVRSNIRELEGSLVRLIAYSSLTHREVTPALAGEVLKVIQAAPVQHEVTSSMIFNAVCGHFHVTLEALRGRKRTNQIAYPRQVVMYLCRKETQMSLVEIGAALGGRDHTTVIYGCDRIEELLATDKNVRADVDHVMKVLRGGSA
jgi:chromosomal replication initiator protein